MQRFVRRKNRPQPGRGPARWTVWEITLMALSLLLIVFPLYAEGYRWLNPLAVPAAPLLQRATFTSVATSPGGATATTAPTATTGTTPSNTPTTGPSPTPSNTPTTGPSPTPIDTPTSGPSSTPVDTPTTGPSPTPIDTPTSGPSPTAADTATPGTPPIASSTPTNGPSPTPTATLTPLPNEPPLRLDKAASVSSVQTNQKFNYTLTVFSNSANDTTVDVRDTIDASLDVLGANSAAGSCTVASNVVTCKVSAQNNQPATINIAVQVRSTAAAGQRISNQAVAQDNRNFTAASDRVVIDVSGGGSPPANTPGGPQASNTPVPPGSTLTPTAVSSNPTATTKPTSSGNNHNNGGGGGGGGGDNQPAATSEIILPPVPQEGSVSLPPTPRSVRPALPAGTRLPVTPVAPTATLAPTPDAGVFFSMGSDWGSAFTSQEINYDILFQNTRESGVINNLSIISALPDNLLFVSASAGYGPDLNTLTSVDPKVLGSEISLTLGELNRGQWVKISVKTKVKDLVATGARIVSQAEATFDGLSLPVRTKPVYVLIVGSELGPSLPLIQGAASATPLPSTTALPSTTPSVVPTAAPSATPIPLGLTDQSRPQSAGGAVVAPAPLPATSQGIPISGILLLGLTLLLRTVRIHRAQSRI